MANFDPFSDTDIDETPKDTKVTAPETDSTSAGVTFSHKPTSGYDSALLVFKALDPAGLLAQYDDPAVPPLIEKAAKVDAYVKAKFAEFAPARESGPAAAPAAQRTPPSNSSPGGETKSCQHGEMVYRSGSKNGKVWKGFFCPTPKDTPGQCSPEFLR